MRKSAAFFALVLAFGCRGRAAAIANADEGDAAAPAGISSTTSATSTTREPVRIEPVDVVVPGDRYAVVVHGAPKEPEKRIAMLFLAGMCTHPGGYAGAFQYTAAERGDLVALQGDVSCGGGPDSPARSWSNDLDAIDRRADAAFGAAGLGVPRDVVVIGYSQGAERAEQLVARFPKKYTRAVLIASPRTPSRSALGRARGVALMAGSFDISRARMRSAATTLERVGVRAAFFTLPGARHGSMGETPEASMREALDFVTKEP